MECPACKNELTEHKVSGIKVDICRGSCGGIWIHHSQIKKIERIKPGSGAELLLFDKVDGLKTYRNAEHPCPNCKTTLLFRHFFSREYDTEVNQCSKCAGFWVDPGGLAKIMKSQNKEKKELIETFFSFINNEKISGMNLANQDIAEAAEMIIVIYKFLNPKY